jgi:hypothetical protein
MGGVFSGENSTTLASLIWLFTVKSIVLVALSNISMGGITGMLSGEDSTTLLTSLI